MTTSLKIGSCYDTNFVVKVGVVTTLRFPCAGMAELLDTMVEFKISLDNMSLR